MQFDNALCESLWVVWTADGPHAHDLRHVLVRGQPGLQSDVIADPAQRVAVAVRFDCLAHSPAFARTRAARPPCHPTASTRDPACSCLAARAARPASVLQPRPATAASR